MRTWFHAVVQVASIGLSYGVAQTSDATGLISTNEMQAYLQGCQSIIDGVTLRFSEVEYGGEGVSRPPKSGASPDNLVQAASWTTVRDGDRYRFKRVITNETDDLMKRYAAVMTWDGVQARTRSISLDTGFGYSGKIAAAPPFEHHTEPFLTWQGWWLFQLRTQRSYADLLTRQDTDGPSLLTNGECLWRARLNDALGSEILFAARRTEDGIRLTWAEFRRYAQAIDDGATRLIAMSRIEYGPPSAQFGTALPESAIFYASHFAPNPERWGLTEIRLLSADVYELEEEMFREQFDVGTAVADERYRLGYVLGEQYLNVDGRVLKTDVPLHGDVGDNLDWWVERGSFAPEPPPGPRSAGQAVSEAASREETSYTVGEVLLGRGPVDVEHEFLVTNRGPDSLDVVTVKPTCGCIEATISKRHIDPGETTTLKVVMRISSPGTVNHGAAVVFSDGSVQTYSLVAYGRAPITLAIILGSDGWDGEIDKVPLRIYSVGNTGQEKLSPPILVEPNGVVLSFVGWTILESGGPGSVRPTRQFGRGILDFGQYHESFPVQVRIRTVSGAEATVIVPGPTGKRE